MNAIVPANFGAVPARFQNAQVQNDLAAGVQGGFGLIGYRGKVWSLRYRGEERQLMRPDGDGPRNSIEVVILKASSHISKIWYEQGYVEGSSSAPDCFSTNGVTPDVGAAKPQSQTCAACPKNAWGSRITPAGKQGKECSDSKRLAVVPLTDLRNEVLGGPMLLRVPAASLQDMATFANYMQSLGYPYCAIGVRISFDPHESYPRFKFEAIRALTEDEAAIVEEFQNSPEVARILAEGAEHTEAPAQPAQAPANGGQPSAPQQTAPVQQAPLAPQPTPAQQVPETSGFGPTTPAQESPGTSGGSSPPVQPAVEAGAVKSQSPSAPVSEAESGPVSAAGGTEPVETTPADTPTGTGFENDLDKKLDALLGAGN